MKYKAETEVINSKIKGEKEASLMILQAEGEAQAAKYVLYIQTYIVELKLIKKQQQKKHVAKQN
jgi:hypothetical protein